LLRPRRWSTTREVKPARKEGHAKQRKGIGEPIGRVASAKGGSGRKRTLTRRFKNHSERKTAELLWI